MTDCTHGRTIRPAGSVESPLSRSDGAAVIGRRDASGRTERIGGSGAVPVSRTESRADAVIPTMNIGTKCVERHGL